MKRIFFGYYSMVYIGTANKLKRIIIHIIDLRESNKDGGHFFMLLYTGKDIHSGNRVELHIYNEGVKRVEELSPNEKQSTFDQYPMFEWSPGIPILDDMTWN